MEPTNVRTSDIEHWYGYHKATEKTAPMHEELRNEVRAFAHTLNHLLPDGRTKFEVFKQLETTEMWANKAIAELAPVSYE